MKKQETWDKLIELDIVRGPMPKTGWDIKRVDLGGIDLSNSSFFGAKLNEANLKDTDLSNSDLSMADLGRADLSGANLSNANFYGAKLYKSNLSGANLQGAHFNMADLGRAALDRADLRYAILHETNLREAYFSEANLSHALLSEANLSNANLSDANLSHADLSKAELIGAYLSEADLSFANFTQANLSKAILKGAKIISVNFNLANLSWADLTGAIYCGVSAAGWNIEGIKAKSVYFCQKHEKDKDRYKKEFAPGEFESLHKAPPMVELIFRQALSPSNLFVLTSLIDKIRRQYPDHDIDIADIIKTEAETTIGIKTKRDKFLPELGQQLYDTLHANVSEHPLAQSLAITRPQTNAESSSEINPKTTLLDLMQCRPVTITYFYSDGSRYETITQNPAKDASDS